MEKKELLEQLIENLEREEIVWLFAKLTDKIEAYDLAQYIKKNRKQKISFFNFIISFLKSYKYDYILNNGESVWAKRIYENIVNILRQRYNNIELKFQGDKYLLFYYYILDRIERFEDFVMSGGERIFYTISKGLYNYSLYITQIGDLKKQIGNTKIQNLDYRIVLKSFLKEDEEWLRVKYEISNLFETVNFAFLGSGGVNSNFIYTFFGSNFYFNLMSQVKYPHVQFWIFDPDQYDIINLFRIIPPVGLRKTKGEELIRAMKEEYFPYFKNGAGSKTCLYPNWRSRRFSPDDSYFFENTDHPTIFIGMVDAVERRSIYSSIYDSKKNFIEITFQDNKFYITLNPTDLSESSLIQETYGQTDNVLFMLSSPIVAKEVEKMILKILKNPDEILPTEQILIDITQPSTFDKVAQLYYLTYQQLL